MLDDWFCSTNTFQTHAKGTGWSSITPGSSVQLLQSPEGLYTPLADAWYCAWCSCSCAAAPECPILLAVLIYGDYTSCEPLCQ